MSEKYNFKLTSCTLLPPHQLDQRMLCYKINNILGSILMNIDPKHLYLGLYERSLLYEWEERVLDT